MNEHHKIKNGIFIFHRDYRTADNIGLMEASLRCENLYCCFIFTPEQVGKNNSYRSNNAIAFMIKSLEELKTDIRNTGGDLLLLYGKQSVILNQLIHKLDITGVFCNKDYTPYALNRDQEMSELCVRHKIVCEMFSDYYLYEPGTISTVGGGAYKKFTPFYDVVVHKSIITPMKKRFTNLKKTTRHIENEISLETAFKRFTAINPQVLVEGGRIDGLKRLSIACREQNHYGKERDHFIYKTTFLSAYIKFGCVSIREVYHALKARGFSDIIRELIWREFFAHVLYAYPDVLKGSYQTRYQHIHWRHSDTDFEKWKTGNTGFPIIDACMRQLNASGFMHNRGRMVVASFLIKVLLLNWRLGEQYFAKRLTDYDPASNNGNWQGISGTGVDMKPYFRDMNPWIQSAKFDKDAAFIKLWVPELKDVVPKDIHRWNEMCKEVHNKDVKYPCPMVDYAEQKRKMLELYT